MAQRLALAAEDRRIRHRWELSAAAAIALQEKLAGRVLRVDRIGAVRHVCGIDVGFEQDGQVARAAVAVLAFPGLELLAYALARMKMSLPYIPGLLSFRETPVVLAALRRVSITPDLLLCDGQGIAHPRRFGLASHLGLAAGIASIGVAKTRLIGEYREPAEHPGAWAPLTVDSECIGAVLRTCSGVKPLYVSIGHRISLETAVEYVLACTPRYRLPETTRWADRLAGASERELARVRAVMEK